MSPPAPGPPLARPLALDGGRGWAIVASGFLALLLGYGSPQSVGVLYPEWLLAFGEGKAVTAWVGSLVGGVGLIVGPVCSVCVVNFGARPVTVFSGVMVAGGLMLSSFAPNVPFLIFSYGVVVGVGVGLLYAATLTITCLYFDKRRGLALGIVSSGTSVGGFLYATLQSELIELLGLDGCLLVIGALALNVVACAGPMRPLTPPRYYLKQRAAILERQLQEEAELSNQKHSDKDQGITTETKEPPVRRRSLFSCSSFIKTVKIKTRGYTQCLSSMLSLLQDKVLMTLCICLFFFSLGQSLLLLLLLAKHVSVLLTCTSSSRYHPPPALPGGPGSELRADGGRRLHLPGLPLLHRGRRGETGSGRHGRHAAGRQRPPVCSDGGSERAGRAAHPLHQFLPGPPGAVGGLGFSERELDSDSVRHQSGGRRGEARRGSWDPHVLRRRRDHTGSSCRRLFLRRLSVVRRRLLHQWRRHDGQQHRPLPRHCLAAAANPSPSFSGPRGRAQQLYSYLGNRRYLTRHLTGLTTNLDPSEVYVFEI
uniref:Monocarboxylate transporter 9-like n=1 Tax=Seriola lalandi dorsalis TaxID=1841481 RepID=A0A3B4XJ37_SERLL